jgi:hypothetical protein
MYATETALGRLIAAGVLIADKVLAGFVNVSFAGGGFNADSSTCGLDAYSGSLTACGGFLVANLQYILAAASNLAAPQISPSGLGRTGRPFKERRRSAAMYDAA